MKLILLTYDLQPLTYDPINYLGKMFQMCFTHRVFKLGPSWLLWKHNIP